MVFDLYRFRWDADHDVMRLDVPRDQRAATDQRVITDLRAGENRGVIRDSDAVPDPRYGSFDFVDVVNVVVMRIDVCVVGDRDVVADLDAAAIVEQDVAVNDDVVSERKVVAKRPLDKVPAFEVFTDTAKDHRREHSSKTMCEQ